MAEYFRPDISASNPYVPPEILPNSNRYALVAALKKSPSDEQLDGDCNYFIFALNDLFTKIQEVQAGVIVGSDEPANAGKLPTTDGHGTITWTKVTETYYADNSISSEKYQQGSVNNRALGNGAVNRGNILPNSINGDLVEYGSLPFQVIQQENNGSFQDYFNAQNDATLDGSKINNLPAAAIPDNSLPGAKLTDASIPAEKLAAVLQPLIGGLTFWPVPVNVAPSGYIFANGQAVSRTTYAALFALYQTTFGDGNGTTTFNVIDTRGRVLVGVDYANQNTPAATGSRVSAATITSGGLTVGGNGGEEMHALTSDENGPHIHTIGTQNEITFIANSGSGNRPLAGISNSGSSGLGTPHNNMQPSILGQWLIYTGVA